MAVLKKHWVPVLGPQLFKEEQLGESYVLETETLVNRSISVNLMNITGDMKKQNFSASFRITSVKEGKAHTRVTGIEMQPSSVKRLVRRGRNKVDDSILVHLKGGQQARIKPLVITKTLTNNSTATAVRNKTSELLVEICKDLTFETLLADIVSMKLQRHLRNQLNGIYPIRSVDIRNTYLLPKFTLDAEQPLEESSYGMQASDEDGERS
jgi:ribosomal protein S3AE